MENALDNFMKMKQDDSEYITLGDSDTVKIERVTDIKVVQKAGFGGEEKYVLRLEVDVMTDRGIRSKKFDNGTNRFAMDLKAKGVKVGSSLKIMRIGMSTKTRYIISDVVNAPEVSVAQSAPEDPFKTVA